VNQNGLIFIAQYGKYSIVCGQHCAISLQSVSKGRAVNIVASVQLWLRQQKKKKKIILECIEVYHSLPALWNIKSKDYINRVKKMNKYEHLFHKYIERLPDADKIQLIKKFNCLHTNSREN
jgi:hypothetical protein